MINKIKYARGLAKVVELEPNTDLEKLQTSQSVLVLAAAFSVSPARIAADIINARPRADDIVAAADDVVSARALRQI